MPVHIPKRSEHLIVCQSAASEGEEFRVAPNNQMIATMLVDGRVRYKFSDGERNVNPPACILLNEPVSGVCLTPARWLCAMDPDLLPERWSASIVLSADVAASPNRLQVLICGWGDGTFNGAAFGFGAVINIPAGKTFTLEGNAVFLRCSRP